MSRCKERRVTQGTTSYFFEVGIRYLCFGLDDRHPKYPGFPYPDSVSVHHQVYESRLGTTATIIQMLYESPQKKNQMGPQRCGDQFFGRRKRAGSFIVSSRSSFNSSVSACWLGVK